MGVMVKGQLFGNPFFPFDVSLGNQTHFVRLCVPRTFTCCAIVLAQEHTL